MSNIFTEVTVNGADYVLLPKDKLDQFNRLESFLNYLQTSQLKKDENVSNEDSKNKKTEMKPDPIEAAVLASKEAKKTLLNDQPNGESKSAVKTTEVGDGITIEQTVQSSETSSEYESESEIKSEYSEPDLNAEEDDQ